ncbi:MAG: CapA family protein [Candidatus Woesebacteria bacterium]
MLKKLIFLLLLVGLVLVAVSFFYFKGQTISLDSSHLFSSTKRAKALVKTKLTLAENNQNQSNSEEKIVKILFTGDLMFDRLIRYYAKKSGNDYIFAGVKETLIANDFVVTNLEGPITNFQSKSAGSIPGSPSNYIFTFDPSLAETLLKHNIKIVNLGNNHILNFGEKGLEQSINYLQEKNIQYFGNVGRNSIKRWIMIEEKGLRIALINFNQFLAGSLEAVLEDIQEAKEQADLLILYPHWGVEYLTVANTATVNLAHQFIDAGVDLIIGHHPHVVQNKEVYKNKTIYYSLGNFVFDQYWQNSVMNGLLVQVKINNKTKEMQFEEIKIQLKTDGQTIIVD